MSRGELFVLSAPSGTGKTTLIRSLLQGELAEFANVHFSVSHTTRGPRQTEVAGRDYHYVDVASFQEMIVEDRFLEWAEVHNNYYGTSVDEVLPYLERGNDVLMDIDVQGAERILSKHAVADTDPLKTAVHSIFIMPPTYRDLELRLSQRNLDDAEQISRRLAVSRWEIKQVELYDYVIVNREADAASHILASIILDKRHRRTRMASEVESVLEDFKASR